jgi:hypothetical protein
LKPDSGRSSRHAFLAAAYGDRREMQRFKLGRWSAGNRRQA